MFMSLSVSNGSWKGYFVVNARTGVEISIFDSFTAILLNIPIVNKLNNRHGMTFYNP